MSSRALRSPSLIRTKRRPFVDVTGMKTCSGVLVLIIRAQLELMRWMPLN